MDDRKCLYPSFLCLMALIICSTSVFLPGETDAAIYSVSDESQKSENNDIVNYHESFRNRILIEVANSALKAASQHKEMIAARRGLAIMDVTPLSNDGRYLEITFNKPIKTIDKFNINIVNRRSHQRHGVEEIQVIEDGYKAILTLYQSAGLKRLTDYSIEILIDNEPITHQLHWTKFINKAKINHLSVEDIKDRTIIIQDEKGERKVVKVPETIDFDFVNAYNKELTIEVNGDNEMVAFKNLSKDKKIKRKKAFIGQYELNERMLVGQIENNIASGSNQVIDLDNFIIVKDHQLIEPTEIQAEDVLLFNDKEKVAEVYNQMIVGKIENIFDRSIEISGESYDYEGYLIMENGKLKHFTSKVAEDIKGHVTLYLDPNDNIVFVSKNK
ncbi:hypothetical protein [Alteribacillus iranensis]|uniref:Uncharacterized protein n=1 Tax=Alteribacillus iranensis TaxID=930128 RepID=A0A1I2F6M4_9BACI|nr:hypothetical protein [Alteribacillus iranensis]SFF00266.1 hypothetical protein SAMN05192532_1099 [Alteribacillus iranensis]